MIFINQSILIYSIILVVVTQLYLIYNNKIENNIFFNLIIFLHMSINSINENNQNLMYLFVIKSTIITYIYFKIVDKKNTQYILISNYIIIMLINTLNFLNIIILIELLNIIFIGIILVNSNTYINFKKKIFVLLVTLNVITLTFFVISITVIISTFRTMDLNIIAYYMNSESYWYIQYVIYISIFIKLGLITGPLFNQHLYNNLNKQQLSIYLYFYYWVIPIIFIQYISVLQINNLILIIVFLFVLVMNIIKLKNFKNIQSLIYISGQVNLIYLQILLL